VGCKEPNFQFNLFLFMLLMTAYLSCI